MYTAITIILHDQHYMIIGTHYIRIYSTLTLPPFLLTFPVVFNIFTITIYAVRGLIAIVYF